MIRIFVDWKCLEIFGWVKEWVKDPIRVTLMKNFIHIYIFESLWKPILSFDSYIRVCKRCVYLSRADEWQDSISFNIKNLDQCQNCDSHPSQLEHLEIENDLLDSTLNVRPVEQAPSILKFLYHDKNIFANLIT